MGIGQHHGLELCIYTFNIMLRQTAITCLLLGATGCRKIQQLPTTAELPAAVCATPETVAVAATLGNLQYLFVANFLLIVVGAIVARLVNLKLGITIAAIAFLGLALAAAAIYFLKAIAITGFAIIVASIAATVAIVCWYVWQQRKRLKIG